MSRIKGRYYNFMTFTIGFLLGLCGCEEDNQGTEGETSQEMPSPVYGVDYVEYGPPAVIFEVHVDGTVVDATDATPIEDIQLSYVDESTQKTSAWNTVSGDSGVYSLLARGLATEPPRAGVLAEDLDCEAGGGRYRSRLIFVDLQEGTEPGYTLDDPEDPYADYSFAKDVEITMDLFDAGETETINYQVSGYVRNEASTGVAGIELQLGDETTTTDVAGRYTFNFEALLECPFPIDLTITGGANYEDQAITITDSDPLTADVTPPDTSTARLVFKGGLNVKLDAK